MPGSRPTATEVRHAREMAANGRDLQDIAKELDLGVDTAFSAIYGLTYAWITDPPPLESPTETRDHKGLRLKLDPTHLRAVRVEKVKLSQAGFARAIQQACLTLGFKGGCTKRHVQQWESGSLERPSYRYRKALELVTGESFESLCQPILPPDPYQAARDLEPLIQQAASLHAQLIDVHRYLMTKPSPISQNTEESN